MKHKKLIIIAVVTLLLIIIGTVTIYLIDQNNSKPKKDITNSTTTTVNNLEEEPEEKEPYKLTEDEAIKLLEIYKEENMQFSVTGEEEGLLIIERKNLETKETDMIFSIDVLTSKIEIKEIINKPISSGGGAGE